MALQNRVTPLGDIVADPARGLVYGNRGCLHDASGRIRTRYNGKRWIACRLHFNDRRRHPLVQPGRYTGLFFLDEATAFAAGHRPCAYCRRTDYERFLELWRELHRGTTGADAIDEELHAERIASGTRAQRHHDAAFDALPDGAFVLHDGVPQLVLGTRLLHWTAAGYTDAVSRPVAGRATLITPPSLAGILRAGWEQAVVPLLHPSARDGAHASRDSLG